jgi:sugar lactone lactonase YvrE
MMHIAYQSSRASLAAVLLLTGCAAGSPSAYSPQAQPNATLAGSRSAVIGLPASLSILPRPLTGPVRPDQNPVGKKLLYVADLTDQDITVYKANKKDPPQIGDITQGVDGPYNMALSKSGTLYVPNSDDNTVTEYPAGKSSPSVTITDGISTPVGLTLDSADTLYVSNFQGNTITVYPKGSTTPSESITSNQFVNIDGLAVDASDNLYVADFSAVKVFEIPKGSTQPEALDLTGLADPLDLAFDSHGNLYVSNPSGNDVDVYPPGQSNPSLVLTDGMSVPYALAIGPNDTLFVSNLYSSPPDVNVFKYKKQKIWETIGPFAGPTGLVAKRV